ncbi:MAG: class I SAM-dependent methyltransferase [Calditrichaeota bacterium]|nr:class I SAM-dependent methyltransferase [Calditrichota bacterium]
MIRQAAALDTVIRLRWPETSAILDVACGIGTQSLGLAALGWSVRASDLSPASVERARREAQARGLSIGFSVADMRDAAEFHGAGHDLVLCADNSLPHLQTDEEILRALRQFFACLRPGGGCLLSMRDYRPEDLAERRELPVVEHVVDGDRMRIWQVWDPDPPHYELSLHILGTRGDPAGRHRVLRTRYYAVPVERVLAMMHEAGFVDVRRLDGVFYQPLLVGDRPCEKSRS